MLVTENGMPDATLSRFEIIPTANGDLLLRGKVKNDPDGEPTSTMKAGVQ